MVVDDDPFVGSVVHGVLTTAGVAHIKVCASGADAVDAAIEFRPELILLDFVMPKMDGRATWKALSAVLTPMPPVIFLTARSAEDLDPHVAVASIAGVISKPFKPVSLVTEIVRLLGPPAPPVVKQPAAKVRRLAAVSDAFHRSLEATAERIETQWNGVRAQGWSREAGEAVLADAHSLAGSAGLFGRHALGAAASEAERLLLNMLKLDRAPSGQEMRTLADAVTALVAACRVSGEVSSDA